MTATADLSVTKTDGVASAQPGTAVTYTIVVSNPGISAAVGATVTDLVPATLIDATWTCAATSPNACGSASGAGGISTTVTVAPAGSVTFTLTATIDPAATGSLTNSASVVPPADVTDPNSSNNIGSDTDTLAPLADLSITKTDGVTSVVAGTAVTYTIVVTNAGPSSAIGALVTDTLPASLTGASWTCAAVLPNSCAATSGSGSISTTVDLVSSGSATFTLTGTVAPATTGTIANTASVAPPAGVTDPTAADQSATDSDTVAAVADLSITKTDNSTTAVPGTPISYVIVVSNCRSVVGRRHRLGSRTHSNRRCRRGPVHRRQVVPA